MKKKYQLSGLADPASATRMVKIINQTPGIQAALHPQKNELVLEADTPQALERTLRQAKQLLRTVSPTVKIQPCQEDVFPAPAKKPGLWKSLEQKERRRLVNLAEGLILIALAVLCDRLIGLQALTFIVYFTSYLVIGGDVLNKALYHLIHGKLLDETFLMSLATIGAFLVGSYPEAVAVMLFYQVGELFQDYAASRSRRSASEWAQLRPSSARVERGGEWILVPPEEIHPGEIIQVQPGERVPLDGLLLDGTTALDASALTGETAPFVVEPGESILSGALSLTGTITIKTEKEFSQSTIIKILNLMENSQQQKAATEQFTAKFARYYTPVVVVMALLLVIVPALMIPDASFSEWLYRGLTFLVVSCPCALVLSIPLGFFGGLGGTSKKGVLVKGSRYLETLAYTETVVFDKTGTLTKGRLRVEKTVVKRGTANALLEYAAYSEAFSDHSISLAIQKAYGKEIQAQVIQQVEEVPGRGVQATVRGHRVLTGNAQWMERHQISAATPEEAGTLVHVAVDGAYLGCLLLRDEIKADAPEAIRALRENGVEHIVMLTGDNQATGNQVASRLGIDEVYAQLLPGDKVDRLEALLEQSGKRAKLAFVGDGIHDAPVLARADIGIAMGGVASDAAIEAADIVIMTDEPSKIASAIHIARKTLSIVRQNIGLALGVKAAVLLAAALSPQPSMWLAVIADVGVAALAILNALRVMSDKKQ